MGGMLLMCQNTTMRVYGARIKIYFMFKTYSSSSSLVITSRWFATSRLVAPVSVRLVYSRRCLVSAMFIHSQPSQQLWHQQEFTIVTSLFMGASGQKFAMVTVRITSRVHSAIYSITQIRLWGFRDGVGSGCVKPFQTRAESGIVLTPMSHRYRSGIKM